MLHETFTNKNSEYNNQHYRQGSRPSAEELSVNDNVPWGHYPMGTLSGKSEGLVGAGQTQTYLLEVLFTHTKVLHFLSLSHESVKAEG